jgi:esterase
MELAYKEYGERGNPPLIILHGLFGMLDNWQMHAQNFAKDYHVYSLDVRNHGRSPHDMDMSYSAMAQDIQEFCQLHLLDNIMLLGHSMGGKIAIKVTVEFPSLIRKLIIADIAPKAYKPGHLKYFEAFRNIDFGKLETRKEADEAFAQFESNLGIRLFLLKNLEKAEEGYSLKFNLDIIENYYHEIIGEVEIPHVIDTPTLFVYGEKSNYVTEDDKLDIESKFLNVEFAPISNAGHWLHADNPNEFFEKVSKFLQT